MTSENRATSCDKNIRLNYYECLAKVILEDRMKDEYDCLLLRDKPDLHDIVMDIGVEVTCCISQKRQELVSYWTKAARAKTQEKKDACTNRIKQLGAEYSDNIPFWRCLYKYEPKVNDTLDSFFHSVEVKVFKLNKNDYADFCRYELFVHSEILEIDSFVLRGALNKVIGLNAGANKKYSRIYLLGMNSLYIFDLDKKNYTVINYTSAEQAQWATAAENIMNREAALRNKEKEEEL